jgi:hypothetical protein
MLGLLGWLGVGGVDGCFGGAVGMVGVRDVGGGGELLLLWVFGIDRYVVWVRIED